MERYSKQSPLVDTSDLFSHPLKRELYARLLQPGLERVLGISKLNALYRDVELRQQPDESFPEAVLRTLKIQYQLRPEDLERLRQIEGPVAVLCNHPYGGIEAMFLVLLLSQIREDYRIMANYMLGEIREVRDHLITVDPFGTPRSRQNNIRSMKQAITYLRTGGLLGIFPAGEVASMKLPTGQITEPAWNPNIGRILQQTGASVVPVYFHGHNSLLFHFAGFVHKRLRTSLLVREFVHPPTSRLDYRIGQVIPAERLQDFDDPQRLTSYLEQKTFLLSHTFEPPRRKPFPMPGLKLPARHQAQPNLAPLIARPQPAALIEALEALPASQRLYRHQDMEVLWFQAHQAPPLMQETGRLREATYRAVGEGSGQSCDVDDFDPTYTQLMIWNHSSQEIVGGYRLRRTDHALAETGMDGLYLNSLFRIQPEFYDAVRPALELGRSYVVERYQKHYLSLMLLWTGIGRFIANEMPEVRYLLGPVSISNALHPLVRDLLVKFLSVHHQDTEFAHWVEPTHPYRFGADLRHELYENLAISRLQDVQEIIREIEPRQGGVPILVKHYLRLGARTLTFNVDPAFQNATDALMLVDLPTVEARTLRKYMGESGYDHSIQHHTDLTHPVLGRA